MRGYFEHLYTPFNVHLNGWKQSNQIFWVYFQLFILSRSIERDFGGPKNWTKLYEIWFVYFFENLVFLKKSKKLKKIWKINQKVAFNLVQFFRPQNRVQLNGRKWVTENLPTKVWFNCVQPFKWTTQQSKRWYKWHPPWPQIFHHKSSVERSYQSETSVFLRTRITSGSAFSKVMGPGSGGISNQ